MTCDEWKKTKVWPYTFTHQELWDAAIASEREACAKVCEDLRFNTLASKSWKEGALDCASAIRARSDKER